MFDRFKRLLSIGRPKSPPQSPIYDNSYITHPKVRHITDREMLRNEGWGNVLTGVGMAGQDKSLATIPFWERLSFEEAAAIYASDPLARKIVKHVVDSALVHDYRFSVPGKSESYNQDFNVERKNKIDSKFKTGRLIRDGATWGRIFGGAYIVVDADDGNLPTAPLELKKIKTINWIKTFDPHEIFPIMGTFNPQSENFLNPEFYTVASYGGMPEGVSQIHHSRVIRFDGNRLLRRYFIQNGCLLYTSPSPRD